jgi:transcriptional regulator with XRE-family HTH domain
MSPAPQVKRRARIRDDVGQRLRDLRKARNFTQSELAARVGIQQSDLCRMENGQYRVSLETLVKILEECKITFSEFFQEEAPAHLAGEEGALLHLYRRMNMQCRRDLLRYARFLDSDIDPAEESVSLPDLHDAEEEPVSEGPLGPSRQRKDH